MVLHDCDADTSMSEHKLSKRKHETIDLTGSDEEETHATQIQKTSRQGHDFAFPTPRSTNPPRGRRPCEQFDSSPQQTPSSAYTPTAYATPRSSQIDNERDRWLADREDEDWNEIMVSTQDGASTRSEDLIFYGDVPTKIVGIRFYNGFATIRERVLVRREPGNPYDSNAIRIDNMRAEQIGHINRQMAAKISKYIDNRWLLFEAELAGQIGVYDCPIKLSMFGPDITSAAGRELIDRMRHDKIPINGIAHRAAEEKRRLAEERRKAAEAAKRTRIPKQATFQGSQGTGGEGSQRTMDTIMEASERFNPREMGKTVEKYGNTEQVLAAMPKAKQPSGISTQLLPYQLQALAWLIDKENPTPPPIGSKDYVQLWGRHQTDPKAFTNLATNFSIKNQDPVLASGGILADDMGLGKTLEMISLIVADFGLDSRKRPGELSNTTLILCPLTVMSNWTDQVSCLSLSMSELTKGRLHDTFPRTKRYESMSTMLLAGSQ